MVCYLKEDKVRACRTEKGRLFKMEGTNERTGALSLKFLASVWNMKYASISRGAERVRWDIQFKVTKVRKISANDHTAADCHNLVFYSAFYWQPVQIHKKGVTCPRLRALQT